MKHDFSYFCERYDHKILSEACERLGISEAEFDMRNKTHERVYDIKAADLYAEFLENNPRGGDGEED